MVLSTASLAENMPNSLPYPEWHVALLTSSMAVGDVVPLAVIQRDFMWGADQAPNGFVSIGLAVWVDTLSDRVPAYFTIRECRKALHTITVSCKAGSLAAAPYIILACERRPAILFPGTLRRLAVHCWHRELHCFSDSGDHFYHEGRPSLWRIHDHP